MMLSNRINSYKLQRDWEYSYTAQSPCFLPRIIDFLELVKYQSFSLGHLLILGDVRRCQVETLQCHVRLRHAWAQRTSRQTNRESTAAVTCVLGAIAFNWWKMKLTKQSKIGSVDAQAKAKINNFVHRMPKILNHELRSTLLLAFSELINWCLTNMMM